MIFLVDASRAMFESQGEDELTPFDMSIQVRHYSTPNIEWVWWLMSLISALRRQRQRDLLSRGLPGLHGEFQDSQGLHRETLSQDTKLKNRKKTVEQNVCG